VLAIEYIRTHPGYASPSSSAQFISWTQTTKRRSQEMNKSTGKTHAVNTHGLWSYARQLLHAFADAGQPSANGLQLFIGPNGGLIWTDSAQVDRSGPYEASVLTIPERSAAPACRQSLISRHPGEPAESLVFAPLEAAARK
jgi:hypothetical protein